MIWIALLSFMLFLGQAFYNITKKRKGRFEYY